jgi:hypothetical protein
MTSSSGGAWREWEGGGGLAKVELWFRFAGGERSVVVRHRAEGEGKRRVRRVDLGEVLLGLASEGEEVSGEGRVIKEVEANLQWDKGETVVFCGLVRCLRVGSVEVCVLTNVLLMELIFGVLGLKNNCDNRRTAEWVGG